MRLIPILSGWFGRLSASAGIAMLVVTSADTCDRESDIQLPDSKTVRELRFDAPDGSGTWFRAQKDIRRIMSFLSRHNDGWSLRADPPYAEFVLSIYANGEAPLVIRTGRAGDAATLQTAASDNGFWIRNLTLAEWATLVQLCGSSPSFALLDPGKEDYRQFLEKTLLDHTTISSTDVDTDVARSLLHSVLGYARLNPQDSTLSVVLRTLSSLYITDFIPGWYTLRIGGLGDHRFSRMVVNRGGKVVPADAQNCLSLCVDQYGDLNRPDNAQRLCAKILEGCNLGRMIGDTGEIPGYHKRPMPPGKEREIRAISAMRSDHCVSYTFYAYHRLGGRVRRCVLILQDDVPVWETHDFAAGIGDGWGLPVE